MYLLRTTFRNVSHIRGISSKPSQVKGSVNSLIGSAKERIGEILGNESMKADGAAEKALGENEKEAAKAKEYAIGTKDSMKGKAKETIGSVIGDDKLQAEAMAKKTKGEAKKTMNA